MNREEARKLLGGYASGTLTPDEQQALFEAALEDQELFDELAREQPLRDLLADPAARARLLRELDNSKAGWTERVGAWMLSHAVGLSATACLLAVGIYVVSQIQPAAERIRMIANEPTRVEVAESFEPAPGARRVFDPSSIPQRSAPAPKLPPPPALPKAALPSNVPLPAVIAPSAQEKQAEGLNAASPTALGETATVARAPFPEGGADFSAQANAPRQGVTIRDAGPRAAASAKDNAAVALSVPRAESAAQSTQSGLRYRVLLKAQDGAFRETSGRTFVVGDVLKLEFELDQPGSVRVAEAAAGGSPGALIADLTAERSATSGEILLDRPGLKQMIAVFTPDPAHSKALGGNAAMTTASEAVSPSRTVIAFEVK